MNCIKQLDLGRRGRQAFTVLELMVVVFIVVILATLILPMMSRPRSRSTSIMCVNNLKQVGLGFRMWAGDNSDINPMHYKTNDFDGAKYSNSKQMFIYFQVMSNELSTPKIVVCPGDEKRSAATNFTSDFNSTKVSYFVGLDADETLPQSVLAGDWNLTNSVASKNGVVNITTNGVSGWTKDIHQFSGNVALGDGSVQKVSTMGLKGLIKSTGMATNRLVFPGGVN
ncbi:type II secretion system protein [Pedosphaera parvula]|uniref:Prepilin-type N-terminal cleavage/methylation domain-containing protein n=1 Tax=Pedosphaera parvula (strain Ellin514) TaxID=320771 RepID=B9XLB2_PEDPL|nr:type II secretion system protein [Pedosphaera parvula]EEF59315.1 hypothetical protein Cflav_PD1863 [Pedosphaera parvula Ellin514]